VSGTEFARVPSPPQRAGGPRRDVGAPAPLASERSAARLNAVELGLVQWFPYGDVARIRRVVATLERLGVRHLRTMLSWADWCRPDGPGWIRLLLDELSGFDVLPVLHGTPPSLGEKPYTSSVPRDLGSYAYFVRRICRDHDGRFTHVQLWNEPTTWCDWDRDADRWWRRFATMVRYAASEANAAGKQVVMAGISPPDGLLLGRHDEEVPHFLEIMEAEHALTDVDVIAFHGFPGTPHWSQGWGGWDTEIAAVSSWARERGMRMWITETGCSRLMPTSRPAELRKVAEAARTGGAERVYWYSVEDVDWTAQREINLDWGCDPHDYATGLTPDLEREIRRLVRDVRKQPQARLRSGSCG
jgi:CDP-paratose 2-epimerase